jgi:hypothetical protein
MTSWPCVAPWPRELAAQAWCFSAPRTAGGRRRRRRRTDFRGYTPQRPWLLPGWRPSHLGGRRWWLFGQVISSPFGLVPDRHLTSPSCKPLRRRLSGYASTQGAALLWRTPSRGRTGSPHLQSTSSPASCSATPCGHRPPRRLDVLGVRAYCPVSPALNRRHAAMPRWTPSSGWTGSPHLKSTSSPARCSASPLGRLV